MTFILVTGIFLVVYPLADSGIVGGGSDGDDALDLAVRALLRGRYPYYQKTYLENPISPLPGAVLLAVPFVLLGKSAIQNIFWLVLFAIAAGRVLDSQRRALILFWTVFVLAPAVPHALVTGSDYLANSLYVMVLSLWLLGCYCPERRQRKSTGILAAVLLGIAFSSRANFIIILPLLCSALGASAGWKTGAKVTGLVFLSSAAATVPFYLHDPAGFSPLHTAVILGQFDSMLPHAAAVIPLFALIISLGFSLRKNYPALLFLRNSTLILALPVIVGILLSSIRAGYADFSFGFFGMFFLFFGVLPFWQIMFEPSA